MSYSINEQFKHDVYSKAVKIYKEAGRSKMRKFVNRQVDCYTAIEWCKEIEAISK